METIFFDFETGGVKDEHPNIQLAAVVVDEYWKELATFEMKIKFDEAKADPEALKMNHYDAAVWAREAKAAPYVFGSFDSFLAGHKSIPMVSKAGKPYSVARLAGHVAATFDMPRLKRFYADRFLPAHPLVLDTLQLAMWFFLRKAKQPENYKLTTILAHLGIPIPDAHDALADVRGAIALAKAIMK